MESWQAMLRSPCLPYRDRCLQYLDNVSISDGLLQRRVLEVTQQFQVEGFQVLDGFKSHVGRVRRRIVESFYTLATQPPAALFFFRPKTNCARCREDTRTHRQQLEGVLYLFAREINRQIRGDTVNIHQTNIHDLPTADRIPSIREPRLFDELTKQQVEMRRSRFREFQHADIIEALAKLPSERNPHLAPAIPQIAICSCAVPFLEPLRVKRQRRHFVEFSFGRYAGNCRAHFS